MNAISILNKVGAAGGDPQDYRLIRYTGESMRYRHGSLLAVLPEIYRGQPLRINNVYAVETRSQGRVYGRYLGLTRGELYGHAVGQPCAVIAPDRPEWRPVEIPLHEIEEVGRVVACLTDERES